MHMFNPQQDTIWRYGLCWAISITRSGESRAELHNMLSTEMCNLSGSHLCRDSSITAAKITG